MKPPHTQDGAEVLHRDLREGLHRAEDAADRPGEPDEEEGRARAVRDQIFGRRRGRGGPDESPRRDPERNVQDQPQLPRCVSLSS